MSSDLPLQRPGSKVRCGTTSGYRTHQDYDEKPCDACVRAKQAYDASRNAAGPRQLKNRQSAEAQRLALQRLSHAHPEEYRALYLAAKAEVSTPKEVTS